MEHQAFCVVCKQRIGVGYVSSDVHQMAVSIHTNCLPGLGTTTEFQLGNAKFFTVSNPLAVRPDYGTAVRGYK